MMTKKWLPPVTNWFRFALLQFGSKDHNFIQLLLTIMTDIKPLLSNNPNNKLILFLIHIFQLRIWFKYFNKRDLWQRITYANRKDSSWSRQQKKIKLIMRIRRTNFRFSIQFTKIFNWKRDCFSKNSYLLNWFNVLKTKRAKFVSRNFIELWINMKSYHFQWNCIFHKKIFFKWELPAYYKKVHFGSFFWQMLYNSV